MKVIPLGPPPIFPDLEYIAPPPLKPTFQWPTLHVPKKTLVVNLFAGPGTGKSTTAAGAFSKLKQKGVSCEIVHEFAKDLVWEDRSTALKFQPYVFGKQAYHIHRLIGQVDVIITDSPILLSSHIYGNGKGYSDEGLKKLALETFEQWNTLNFVIRRNLDDHPYVAAGRNQTQQEAEEIDGQIVDMLNEEGIVWLPLNGKDVKKNIKTLVALIQQTLAEPQDTGPNGMQVLD
jgi:hypothetical protein